LPAGCLPQLAGLEAVVRVDDRTPAGPDVDREPDRAIGHRFVAGDPLDLGHPGRRDVLVFLDGGDPGAVGDLGPPLRLIELFVRDPPGLPATGSDRTVAPQPKAEET